VRRCFAAASADRVSTYHGDRTGGGPVGMAVLVQAMVDAKAAGVAFTAHPVTGDRDQVLVTAVAGLGDPLVSGRARGEEWTTGTTGTPPRHRPPPPPAPPPPPRPGLERVLTPAQASEITELARSIARHYGRPQDVEWALD